MRPGLVEVLTSTPGVAPYFDLSFQHASGPLLRRMRRFGDAEQFLALIASIRSLAPAAGIRSNVIVGFPGETETDLQVLCDFLAAAELDAVGVFGYSDEDGTEALTLPHKVDDDVIRDRVERVSSLVEKVTNDRAAFRRGESVEVLLETVDAGTGEGRAAHQGPEVDGTTALAALPGSARVGQLWRARVIGSDGVDLLAEPVEEVR
jgi:tRNA A37 methylthiotransferase MiaB